MNHETMTVHEALAELKMLDKRISLAIEIGEFSIDNRHSNTKINGKTVEEYIADAQSAVQSIFDLEKRRKAIRNALSLSNATTTVVVGGVEYTVAEAIEMKRTGLDNKRLLLERLNSSYINSKEAARRSNEQLESKADQYVVALLGSKEKAQTNEALTLRKAYIDANTVDVVTLPNIEDVIRKLSEEIDIFEAEIDAKLSISNALTKIDIEY